MLNRLVRVRVRVEARVRVRVRHFSLEPCPEPCFYFIYFLDRSL
jgi:hypothetical protein